MATAGNPELFPLCLCMKGKELNNPPIATLLHSEISLDIFSVPVGV